MKGGDLSLSHPSALCYIPKLQWGVFLLLILNLKECQNIQPNKEKRFLARSLESCICLNGSYIHIKMVYTGENHNHEYNLFMVGN